MNRWGLRRYNLHLHRINYKLVYLRAQLYSRVSLIMHHAQGKSGVKLGTRLWLRKDYGKAQDIQGAVIDHSTASLCPYFELRR